MKNQEINPEDFYLLEDVKTFLENLSIDPFLVESLYIFDYDLMQKLVKGIHIKNLIEEHKNKNKKE